MIDINNFVINRVRRATMFSSTTGEAMWNINQVEEPSLKVTTEKAEAVDAIGVKIMTFDRAKAAEFTASNSLFDFGLAAAQFGKAKEVAAAGATLVVPRWEEKKLTAEDIAAGYVTLLEVPAGTAGSEIPFIYTLNGDGTIKAKYAPNASAASATQFKLTAAEKKVAFPTGLTAGTVLWIPYEYAAEDAVVVSNTAVDFPKAGKFVMEVLGSDVCDPTTLYYAYVEFPNAKLSGDVDISFTTDGKHPFTIEAMQQYCDSEKRLFSIKIPEAIAAA